LRVETPPNYIKLVVSIGDLLTEADLGLTGSDGSWGAF